MKTVKYGRYMDLELIFVQDIVLTV